jgi:hypothetical protein
MVVFARYSRGQKTAGFGIPAVRVIAFSRATSASVAALNAARSGRVRTRIVPGKAPAGAHRRLASFSGWFRKEKTISAFTFRRRDLAICRVVCRFAIQTQGNRAVRKIFRFDFLIVTRHNIWAENRIAFGCSAPLTCQ